MSFIYVITNTINGKQYVGKTDLTIEQRFHAHIRDSKVAKRKSRPLYRAFNKYGIENFTCDLLEECSSHDSSAREIYWIGRLDTYRNGYNATLGGDGKHWKDYKTIAEAYQNFQNVRKTSAFCECDTLTVKKACQEYNIKIKSSKEIALEQSAKKVAMLSSDGQIIRRFNSIVQASNYLIDNNIAKAKERSVASNISRVISGERKNAYGYKWIQI